MRIAQRAMPDMNKFWPIAPTCSATCEGGGSASTLSLLLSLSLALQAVLGHSLSLPSAGDWGDGEPCASCSSCGLPLLYFQCWRGVPPVFATLHLITGQNNQMYLWGIWGLNKAIWYETPVLPPFPFPLKSCCASSTLNVFAGSEPSQSCALAA